MNKTAFTPDPEIFFGDYLAIDIQKDMVHAMWPEMRNKKISLKHARIGLKKRVNSNAKSKM